MTTLTRNLLPTLQDVQVVDSSFMRNNWGQLTTGISKTLKPILVQKRNKDRYAVIDIDAYEDFLLSQNQEYLQSIAGARGNYKKGNYITLEEMMRKLK